MADGRKKAKNTGKAKDDTFFVKCIHCGRELSTNNGNFYRANEKTLFKGNKDDDGVNWLPVCKTCVKDEIYIPYLHETKDYYKAVYYTCRKLDLMYTNVLAETALNRSKGDTNKAIGYVFGLLGSLQQYSGQLHNFDDSEHILDEGGFEDKVASIKNGAKMDSESKRARRDVKKKLGYDPFENNGLTEYELNFLYNDLVGFLSADDELATDTYKLNIVLQIVNGNQQIRALDMYLSVLNSSIEGFKDNMAIISTFIEQKKKLIDNNVKLYKENKSWLEASSDNKSKLGYLMRKYRNYGFDEIEVDFLDMATSNAVKKVMDLSHTSICDTINWSSEEEKEVILMQREIIGEKDSEIARLEKEKRQLAIELRDFKKEIKN